MSNKKKLLLSVGSIVGATILFITISTIVVSSKDSLPAFTGNYDVNTKDELIVVNQEKERQSLSFLPTQGQSQALFEAEEDYTLFSPIFMSDNTVAFIHTSGFEPDKQPGEQRTELAYSTIFTVDVSTNEVTALAETRGILTDLVYIAENDQLLASGENINQEDVPAARNGNTTILYEVSNGKLVSIYEGSYTEPGSMQATDDGELLMVLPDDQGNWDTDSMFEAIERIYKADPMEKPLSLELVSNENKTEPITDVAQIGDDLIYQTIMNFHDDGNYDYDLVSYSLEKKEEGDRLRIGSSVESLRAPNEHTLYYVKRDFDYNGFNQFSLFRYDLENHIETEIHATPSLEEST